MASPISPGEAIAIVKKAVETYKKIREAPEQVKKVGRRMKRLESYLEALKELLDQKKRHALASLRPAQTRELNIILNDIEEDAEKVYKILEKWDKNIGPFGLQFRFKSVGEALFALGSNPDKLEELTEEIELHKNDVSVLRHKYQTLIERSRFHPRSRGSKRYIVLLIVYNMEREIHGPVLRLVDTTRNAFSLRHVRDANFTPDFRFTITCS
jgi:uncharacterized protein (DUF342 family)